MIHHSYALLAWETIWENGFPFHDSMKNGAKHVGHIYPIYMYFHQLKKNQGTDIKTFDMAGTIFFDLAQYIPSTSNDVHFKLLRDYFAQRKNYTPINKKTGRRFYE